MAELKNGFSRFDIVGKVKLTDTSLEDAKLSASGKWMGVNTRFGIEIDDSGNSIFVDVNGGYMPSQSMIKKLPRERQETFAMVEIPFADRLEKEMIDKVQYSDLFSVSGINSEDPKEAKQFILANDFLEYLQEHLTDGEEVVVSGTVSYSWDMYGDSKPVYRNYQVNNIYVNPIVEKEVEGEDGEVTKVKQLKHKRKAEITQQYLVTEDTAETGWEKTLEKEGKVTLPVRVPAYVGKTKNPNGGKWDLEVKKTIPMPQVITVSLDGFSGDKKALAKYVKAGFDIKGEDKVRAVTIINTINEGFETSRGGVTITKELQDLIDNGVLQADDLQSDLTVRGQRISELVFSRYKYRVDEEGKPKADFDDELYKFSDLVLPSMDTEEFSFPDLTEDDDLPFSDAGTGDDVDFSGLFN